MEYHLLRETTDGSGVYEMTGEVLSGSLHQAIDEVVLRTQAGHRHAIYFYESINRRPAASSQGSAAIVPGTEEPMLNED